VLTLIEHLWLTTMCAAFTLGFGAEGLRETLTARCG